MALTKVPKRIQLDVPPDRSIDPETGSQSLGRPRKVAEEIVTGSVAVHQRPKRVVAVVASDAEVDQVEGTDSIQKRRALVLDKATVRDIKNEYENPDEVKQSGDNSEQTASCGLDRARMLAQQKLKMAREQSGLTGDDQGDDLDNELEPSQLGDQELEQVFGLFDTDQSATLEFEELLTSLRCLGLSGSAAEVSEVVMRHGFDINEGADLERFRAISYSLSDAYEVTADDAEQFLTVVFASIGTTTTSHSFVRFSTSMIPTRMESSLSTN
jgi:hypothetical protein